MRNVIVRLLVVLAVGALGVFGPVPQAPAQAEREDGREQQVAHPDRYSAPPPASGLACPVSGGANVCRHALRLLKCVFWTMLIVHILLAVWVYTDIRKRGEGHGLFIVLALLTGICGAILYALVRIGDRKA